MSTSNKFSTLLLREWMQHKRGWMATIFAPPLIFLAILPFGTMQFDKHSPMDYPLLAGVGGVALTTVNLFAIAMIAITFQLASLARRDVQDRSIEFWLSLPAGHVQSLGATLLAHVLLMPLAALLVGFGMGFIVTAALALKIAGTAGLAAVPWAQVAGIAFPLLLRWIFGVLLAALWVSPLAMIVMANSAWLKRWSIPAMVGALIFSLTILPKVYGIHTVQNWLSALMKGAVDALTFNPEAMEAKVKLLAEGQSVAIGSDLMADAWRAVQNLASPDLALGLVIAAAGFALLILRRQRAG